MKSDDVKSFVIVMLLLQAISTAFLWILNVLSVETTGVFAVLLAANLIAFAVVVEVYRNPDNTRSNKPTPEPTSTAAAPAAPAPKATQTLAAAPEQTTHSGPIQAQKSSVGPALPRTIHTMIPVASILVLLAFAVITFLPANKSTLPTESTTFFIPIYLGIVVVLVFGSMYLFKRIMDAEDSVSAR